MYKGTRRHRGALVLAVAAYLIAFVILLPLLWIFLLSFQSTESILNDPFRPVGFDLENYIEALTTIPLGAMFGNTLILAASSVGVGTVISFMSSFAIARMVFRRRRIRSVLRLYLIGGLAIPVYVLLFPVYRLDITIGVFGSYLALILPYIAVTIPFNTLLFTGFLADFPQELEEAAIIDGAGLTRLCWSVVLPLMKPVIATVVIFNVIYVVNEFPFVSILVNTPEMTTVSLAVSQFQGQYNADYGAMMAAMILILIPQLAMYALFQKQVVSGMTMGSVKG